MIITVFYLILLTLLLTMVSKSLVGRWVRTQRIIRRFAFFPTSVEGTRVWFKSYYCFQSLHSVSLGGASSVESRKAGRECKIENKRGSVSVVYQTEFRFLTKSELKKKMKENGFFSNRYNKKQVQERNHKKILEFLLKS